MGEGSVVAPVERMARSQKSRLQWWFDELVKAGWVPVVVSSGGLYQVGGVSRHRPGQVRCLGH